MIKKGGTKSPRRCVLYGTSGIGKTTWGCSAPSPLLLPIEDNNGVVDCDSLDRPKSFDEAMTGLREAYGTENYKTIVIDSLDWLERLIHAKVCADQDKPIQSIEEIGYGKGYAFALNYWRQFLEALDKLREKGYMIICLAHSQIQRYEAPGEQAYDRFNLRMHKNAAAFVTEWADEVFFMRFEVFVSKGKGDLKAKAQGDGTRIISVCETPAWVAKNRLRLTGDLSANFNDYLSKIS